MAFKTVYPIVGGPNRVTAGPDPVPTRGTVVVGGGGLGTTPDFWSKEYHQARLTIRFLTVVDIEEPLGTCDIEVWYRDIPEVGDRAQNVAPSPPIAADILWVKGFDQSVTYLEEVIIPNAYQRGVYVRVRNIAGGAATKAELYLAPFDSWAPFEMVG